MNKFPAVFFCRCRGSCFPILVKLVPLHKQLAIAGDLGHMLQSLTGHEAGNYTLGLTRMTWPRSSTSCLKVINGDPFPQRPVPLGHWDHRGKAHTHTHTDGFPAVVMGPKFRFFVAAMTHILSYVELVQLTPGIQAGHHYSNGWVNITTSIYRSEYSRHANWVIAILFLAIHVELFSEKLRLGFYRTCILLFANFGPETNI